MTRAIGWGPYLAVVLMPSAIAACGPAPAVSSRPGAQSSSPSPTLAASATAVANEPDGLEGACAAQWAASLATYDGADPGVFTAYLLARSGGKAPNVAITGAALLTDHGSVPLLFAPAVIDEGLFSRATRVDFRLAALPAGAYRASFIELEDPSGTWRFRIGELLVRVVPGPAPTDLVQTGGTISAMARDGGSVQGFEVGLRNTTPDAIDVVGVATDIPGLAVTWLIVETDPVRPVDSLRIPALGDRTVTFGTALDARPVSFVLATPEIRYGVGTGEEQRALFEPITFISGFGTETDVDAYAATLPDAACGRRP